MESSIELKEMIGSGIGYRTESYSGSGKRDLRKILHFEIDELGNADILIYCEKWHGFDLLNAKIEMGYGNYMHIEDLICTHGYEMAERLYKFIQKEIGVKKPKGLWLTTKSCAETIYGEGEDSIDSYNITGNIMILSDLGPDGSLFVFNKIPS